MIGKQSEKITYAPSLSGNIPLALEYMLLFGIGIVAIVLHAYLRTPLNLPGHHGLEFMALLMAGRVASRLKWASSISAMGIGFILLFPVFGFKDPFMGFNYMFPGIVIDIVFNIISTGKYRLFILALIGGLAYFTIPLSRLVIHFISGYPYSSFIKHGYLVPLAGFFVFGLAGSFVGTGITKAIIQKIFSKK